MFTDLECFKQKFNNTGFWQWPREEQIRMALPILSYLFKGEGCGSEQDRLAETLVSWIMPNIPCKELNKDSGRFPAVKEEDIQKLADEGYSAAAIAEKLHCSTSRIYHSLAWKNRKARKSNNQE